MLVIVYYLIFRFYFPKAILKIKLLESKAEILDNKQ